MRSLAVTTTPADTLIAMTIPLPARLARQFPSTFGQAEAESMLLRAMLRQIELTTTQRR
jgi:hypothetical protein